MTGAPGTAPEELIAMEYVPTLMFAAVTFGGIAEILLRGRVATRRVAAAPAAPAVAPAAPVAAPAAGVGRPVSLTQVA